MPVEGCFPARLHEFGSTGRRINQTGEIVPLLQIVPSKSKEERLLLVSPKLARVLAGGVTLPTLTSVTLDLLASVIARCLEAEEALTRREANTRGRSLSGR
ncbi:hypothetical protein ACIA98_16605 [Streptomyces sp. NPDC051366]|uniref:hypothetical protein n=1 Tax=Streptomyces sp. NPDC051366 TaxID=3365652 RepID=UPI003798AC03